MDLKICVCHSPNKNDFSINYKKIYLDVVAGSDFENNTTNSFLKDNTGDNISNKNQFFNELTVQYWAWKNLKADYYGFCHYRRFLTFGGKFSESNERNQILIEKLTNDVKNKYDLCNDEVISNELNKYDCISSLRFPTKNILTPKGFKDKNREHYLADNNFFDSNVFDITREIIKNKFPKYIESYDNYLNADFLICHNCFIMKKELFFEFCEFQFGVLFEFEKRLDMSHYSSCKVRACGYMSEVLNAVFILDLIKRGFRVLERPVLFIKKTEKIDVLRDPFNEKYETLVFSANDAYVPYFCVTLASFIKNSNPIRNYEIIVLHNNISESNKEIIKLFVSSHKNIKLVFFDVTYHFDETKLFINYKNVYSFEVYYRLLSPYILKNRDKALLLDSDLIFNEGFDSIFDINMDKYCVACVKDLVYQGMLNLGEKNRERTTKELDLSDPYKYVNAGVIFANYKNMRKHICFDKLFSLCCKRFEIQDQDVLNKVFNKENLIYYLPIKYNLFNYSNDWVQNNIKNSIYSDYVEYLSSLKHPYIIHYANKPKPWENLYLHLGTTWWMYCRLTPYYEQCIKTFFGHSNLPVITHSQKIKRKFNIMFPVGTKRRRLVQVFIPKRGSKLRTKLSKIIR